MNLYSSQPYLRPVAKSSFRQHLCKQKVFSLSGDKRLWIAVGKVLFVLGPVLLSGNLWLASLFENIEKSVHTAESVHHELKAGQNSLTAKRNEMLSQEWIQNTAAEKLSLQAPAKEQVMVL